MRIDETSGTGARPTPIQRRLADLARNPLPQPTSDPNAAVELSSEGRALMRASQIARSTPDVRADRVAELRAQVEAGTYRVNSHDLARRILEELGATAF